MEVGTYKARCEKCGTEFSYPSLGDFSYGSFLFVGEKGGVFGYFCGLNNAVWDFVAAVLVKKGSDRDADLEHGARIQAACAHFADPIQGQTLCAHEVCPVCQFKKLNLWSVEQTGVIEIAEVMHTAFASLPKDVRRERILKFDRTFWEPSQRD